MIELLALVLLTIPVIIFVMALVALGRSNRLLERQKQFEITVIERLNKIEEKLHGSETPEVSSAIPQESIAEPAPESSQDEETDDTPEEAKDQLQEAARAGDDADEPEAAAATGPWQGLGATLSGKASNSGSGDLESQLGGKWSVLLGGLALALGVILLVRHSIEAGYLGPAMRVTLGLGFSAILFAAGEILRRSDKGFNLPVYAKADVPGILTGAGACGAFASLFAAHSLYGFIGPGTAFVALTLVGIVTMLLSAIHGPKLAAIGVLGAYGTPVLVSSDSPNTLALAIHILVVTAVVLTLAQVRNWRWLAISGFVISGIWTGLAAMGGAYFGISGALMVCGLTVMFSALFYLREGFADQDREFEKTAAIAFFALGTAALFQLAVNHQLPDTMTALVSSMIIVALAIYRSSVTPVVITGVVITIFTILQSDLPFWIEEGQIQTSDWTEGLVPRNKAAFVQNAVLLALPPALLALWGSWKKLNIAPRAAAWLASAVSALAFFAVLVTYLRVFPFETRPFVGMLSLALAGALGVATEAMIRREDEGTQRPAPAALAVGVVALASLAFSIALDTGWLPLAFALTTLGIAYIQTKRPLSTLPWLAVISTVITGITMFANMPSGIPDVSSILFFNGLIVLFGIPAAALLGAGLLLRGEGDRSHPLAHGFVTSSGLAVLAFFVAMQLNHAINNGSLATARQSLAEFSAYTLAALGFAAGLQLIAKRSGQTLFDKASLVAGAISIFLAAFGLLGDFNPAFNSQPVGDGYVFNLLLPGYLLTGLAAGGVTLLSRNVRPVWYTLGYAALSGALLFAYCSLMLRNVFQNPVLNISRNTSDLEFLLYSPLWLVLGGAVLTIGMRFQSRAIRAASGLIIGLTVFKVFLLDMAALEGILRALSFIGLGVTLIIIGRFYQRILTRNAASAPSPSAESPEAGD